ncbi:MAG TPA: methyltransferase [Bryobacteraceae bacterium]|nr:methyltransferase [Bryobacteraceae bacterium]
MNNSSNAPVTPERIMQFAWGYAPPLIIEAALQNRVFDVLDSGPKTVREVQAETGASERGLTAIMNALVGLDLLHKDQQGRYSLTPESAAFLVTTKPGFQGLIRHTSRHLIPKWLHLAEIVKTGKPLQSVNQEATGSEFFQKFVSDLFAMSYGPAQKLAQHLNFKGTGKPVRVLDLAAGSGVWGIALAQSSEQVHVTALDWPGVLPVTRNTVARFSLIDRFSFLEGDLLSADFGSNYDVATLGQILHSEGEERSRTLLAKTFRALSSGGTIAIAEFLVNPDRTGPPNGLLFAVNMLVNTDEGDTYSFEEISSWLKEAGFTNPRTLESPGPSPLILATKP